MACLSTVDLKTALLVSCIATLSGCSDDDDDHGPYWEDSHVVPNFAVRTNELSTSFEGYVDPMKSFLFGAADGFHFDKPNAKLTVNANSVWARAPIFVALYDGSREGVGSDATRIVGWVVPTPEGSGGSVEFSWSDSLNGRTPAWALVDFVDFSGVAILQVLGHD